MSQLQPAVEVLWAFAKFAVPLTAGVALLIWFLGYRRQPAKAPKPEHGGATGARDLEGAERREGLLLAVPQVIAGVELGRGL